ncbi:hypothetical protein ERX37_05055 [Macrococcus hajekii]|uniref:Uncharacterized protein n=1 Tax=Macrococcus hajekii TaxID=198482 RepID=A0A4R6BNL0_9STAP|nr:hypothetical protein [Macrococcus hajekii]TDM03453.1 hypothetical protein ERX37_05055 [Macrococcus hajekii]GGA99011.1 hypothetical protein GCM10007190_03780 [Macrococcus hajekii]
MKYILTVLAVITIIIEASLNYAHPFMMAVPTDYFEQPELPTFMMAALLTFGIGQAAIPLLIKHKSWSLKRICLVIVIGLIDKWLFSSSGYVLALGIGLLLAYYIKKSWVGYMLLATGLFAIAIPLLILYFPAETFMDAAKFQEQVTLFKSNDYMHYILNSMSAGYIWIVVTAVFIVLPLLLIDWTSIRYRYTTALLLFTSGIFIKTLVIQSESVLVFSLLMIIGGLMQGIALYLLLSGSADDRLIPTLAFSSLLMLLAFTGVGLGDYQNMPLETVLMRAVIIMVITLISYLILTRKKNANF